MNSKSNSSRIINQLIGNLESQLEIHKVLLDALVAEGTLPASCTLMELNEVHSIRDFAVLRVKELERQRQALVESYRQHEGLQKSMSLKDIIKKCDPARQEQLNNLRNNLLEVIAQIKPTGKQNAEIAIARIACFSEVQKVFDKSFRRLSTYSGNGTITKAKGSSRMSRSI